MQIYENDNEYQQSIFNLINKINPEVTLKEYNDNSFKTFLDCIYSKTSSEPRFIELYSLAAGTMFSEDNTLGLAVLFSYDYFYLFNKCLMSFFTKPLDNNDSFSSLMKLLRK
jgi:hypothetical protein